MSVDVVGGLFEHLCPFLEVQCIQSRLHLEGKDLSFKVPIVAPGNHIDAQLARRRYNRHFFPSIEVTF